MSKIQLISAIALCLEALYIIRLIRKRRIDLKYALPWLAVACMALVVDCFPGLLSGLADLMGIATPVNALFLLALCFQICLLFTMTMVESRHSERIKQLAQAAALSEDRIRVLEEELDRIRSGDPKTEKEEVNC